MIHFNLNCARCLCEVFEYINTYCDIVCLNMRTLANAGGWCLCVCCIVLSAIRYMYIVYMSDRDYIIEKNVVNMESCFFFGCCVQTRGALALRLRAWSNIYNIFVLSSICWLIYIYIYVESNVCLKCSIECNIWNAYKRIA